MDITTANRLYELRKQHRYSQDELADMLNVSRQAVSKWERSESSPDTDNLIALAKLYNVSLDELLGFNHEDAKEQNNAKTDVNDDKNDSSNADCDKKTDVHIGDHVHIDENGIHVKDKNGEQVHITGGIAKFVNKIVGDIHIDDDFADNDDDDIDAKNINIGKSHISFNGKNKNAMKIKGIISACATCISLAVYLTIGFVCNLWHPGWLVFFFPIIVDGIAETIITKNAYHFPIPAITTTAYLLLGCGWGMWHPYWIIFCALPIYYMIVGFIKSIIKSSKEQNVTIDIQTDDNAEIDTDADNDSND